MNKTPPYAIGRTVPPQTAPVPRNRRRARCGGRICPTGSSESPKQRRTPDEASRSSRPAPPPWWRLRPLPTGARAAAAAAAPAAAGNRAVGGAVESTATDTSRDDDATRTGRSAAAMRQYNQHFKQPHGMHSQMRSIPASTAAPMRTTRRFCSKRRLNECSKQAMRESS